MYPIYPMLIPYASFGQVPMRFQSGSNEVPMEMRGKQEASHRRTLETIEKTDMRLGISVKKRRYINLMGLHQLAQFISRRQ